MCNVTEQENTYAGVSFLIELQAGGLQKETPVQFTPVRFSEFSRTKNIISKTVLFFSCERFRCHDLQETEDQRFSNFVNVDQSKKYS